LSRIAKRAFCPASARTKVLLLRDSGEGALPA